MNKLKPIRLAELRTQATFLLKDLSHTSELSLKAAGRLLQHPVFADKTVYWLIEQADKVKLKHAYAVLALENGFANWADFRNKVIENDCLYYSSGVAFIHAWFKDYEVAHAYFIKNGGYLLSFWGDYVVCGKEYIDCLGLGDYETQWSNIGYNWHKPKDFNAFETLKEVAVKNYLAFQ